MAGKLAIHRTAIVAPGIEIGDGTIVGPFAVLLAPCAIGRDCWIGPHVVIGTTAEHTDAMTVATVPEEASIDLDDHARQRIDELVWLGSHGAGVTVGDRSIIREHSTVHQGTVGPTVIGSDVFVMTGSYIGHDVTLCDRVRVAPSAKLAGHVWVGSDANVGMASGVHQHRAVGAGAMIGMHATVVKDVAPFESVRGNPARAAGLNVVGMARMGFTETDIEALRRYYEDRGEVPGRFQSHFADWGGARAD